MISTRGSATGAANSVPAANDNAATATTANVAPTPPIGNNLAADAPQTPDPAMAAQIASIGPALAALAAALATDHNNGSISSHQSTDQPEDEPGNSAPGMTVPTNGEEATITRQKQSFKVDLRNVKIEKFDGTVPVGSFDSKAREFCEELDEQMDDAQALAGQVWDGEVKRSVFKMFLTGMARRWYRDWRTANPNATYHDAADSLMHEFRPTLLGVDIASKIKTERKKRTETYREFADRLTQMSDALEGGKAVPANQRHALVAFVRNAYPRYTDFLETKLRLGDENPAEQLKLAVSTLTQKTETDGRIADRDGSKINAFVPHKSFKSKPTHSFQTHKNAPFVKKFASKRPAAAHTADANVAQVERKKKMKSSPNSSQKNTFKCYECGASGHTADFCRTYLQGNTAGKYGKASAQMAEAEDSDAEDLE